MAAGLAGRGANLDGRRNHKQSVTKTMKSTELDKLQAWLRVIGLGVFADAMPGYIEIVNRPDFWEIYKKRMEEET